MKENIFSEICDLVALEKNASSAFVDGNLGELFVEYREDEAISIENSIIQAPSSSIKRGFGLRCFKEDVSRYSYSSSLTTESVKKAVSAVSDKNCGNELCVEILRHYNDLYDAEYFLNNTSLSDKIKVLQSIDVYARSTYSEVRQVVATIVGSWQAVSIFNDEGRRTQDYRPLVRLTINVVIEKDGKIENGSFSVGGRYDYDTLLCNVENLVDEAVKQAQAKIQARPSQAGEMPVVLGNGWTGVLLHEAVGHGLEGDAIRKKTSVFYNLLGKEIASKAVTVVDDGTIAKRRGSLNMDDEGNPTKRNVLIQDGKLVGFMQDRMNARLMNVPCTGNGRRESFECVPMPRMTNTFMLSGKYSFDDLIKNVKRGIYAKSFSGGQVDTASGKFVFNASEAYMIENGEILYPVKGATLIGDGASVLKRIQMVANDFCLDNGVGTCGKCGQWVPVGVGEPSALIDKITVGGSDI